MRRVDYALDAPHRPPPPALGIPSAALPELLLFGGVDAPPVPTERRAAGQVCLVFYKQRSTKKKIKKKTKILTKHQYIFFLFLIMFGFVFVVFFFFFFFVCSAWIGSIAATVV